MPPTLITRTEEIRSFRAQHRDIILSRSTQWGAGVFRVKDDDETWALLEMFTQFYREPVIVQRYVPDVRKGDKRILLVDGEFAGHQSRAGRRRGTFEHACGRQSGGDIADDA